MGIYSYSGPDDVRLIHQSKSAANDDLLFGNNLQHLTFSQITSYLSKANINPLDYTYFTIIRHPTERLISHFKSRRMSWTHHGTKTSLCELFFFLIRITAVRPHHSQPNLRIFHYIKRFIYPQYHHILSQSEFIYNPSYELQVFDINDIKAINNFLLLNGYSALPSFRVSKMKISPLLANILSFYSSIFYSKDHALYDAF